MNKKIRVITIVTALAISAFVLFGPKGRHAAKETSSPAEVKEKIFVPGSKATTPTEASSSSTAVGSAHDNFPPTAATAPQAELGPVTEKEMSSLRSLASVLFEEAHGPSRPVDLVRKLKELGFRPMVATDSNESTGAMVVVRTENALPGTRYFHAQFFTDESGQFYPQHVSFEFRPSQSMDDVVASLERSFGRLGRPSTNDGTWMIWKLPNDYTLWIKRLEKSDLESNAYNAYSPSDLNTIRVAIEKDVPGHEDEDAPN